MPKLDHPLDLLDSFQFILLVSDVDDLHRYVSSKPNAFMNDAETTLTEFFSRKSYLLEVYKVLVARFKVCASLCFRGVAMFSAG